MLTKTWKFIISMQVRLLSLGATVHSVIYPGEEEEEGRDVVLGFDKVCWSVACTHPHIHAHAYPAYLCPGPCPLLNAISFNSNSCPSVSRRLATKARTIPSSGELRAEWPTGDWTSKVFPYLIPKNRLASASFKYSADHKYQDHWGQGGDRWRNPPALTQRLWHQVPPPCPWRQE